MLPCCFTVKISPRGHKLLIYIVKRNTKTDGMGPFKILLVLTFGIISDDFFALILVEFRWFPSEYGHFLKFHSLNQYIITIKEKNKIF